MSTMVQRVCLSEHTNRYRYLKNDNSCSNVGFRGHIGAERYFKDGITYLRKETGLFRDWQTLLFVKNYIEKNFADKKTVNIVSGGCSTGEEAVSMSILLNNIKDKVHILGIDLSKDAILKANSRKFEFKNALNLPEMVESDDMFKGMRDRFLVFNTTRSLSKNERKQKMLFYKFFVLTDEKMPKENNSTLERIKKFLADVLITQYRFETKIAKLKDGCVENCTFKVGNVSDINALPEGIKSDVIFFKNAIYHVISYDIDYGPGR